MLHYAAPPTVGGVEAVMMYHARGLADLGYKVRVVTGSGAAFDDRVEVYEQPLFGSRHPDVLAVKAELDLDIVSPAFEALVQRQQAALIDALAGCEVCIVHNIHTLNKNLPLTTALARHPGVRWLAWCHDLAWTNEQYLPELYEREPWTLLKQVWANTVYITVSEPRRAELAALLQLPPEAIHVITAGVAPADFFHWTPLMQQIEAKHRLLDADGLLLLPARLTRRKNIALGLHVLAAIRHAFEQDYRLIVTGPPGPHNPANPGYLRELLDLRQELGLENAVHFLYELSDPPMFIDDDTMANLYQISDALFFPSTQEGFGIPMLEAGFAGLPIFCSDIPPFRETGGEDVTYFDPLNEPAADIAARILSTLIASPTARLRVRVRHHFRWQSIIQNRLVPLLEVP